MKCIIRGIISAAESYALIPPLLNIESGFSYILIWKWGMAKGKRGMEEVLLTI